ncbi:TonB-dependent receptor [Kineobactrum sediminis]|uniref:TonB-dependent receptor n=1 Tax=Kineobactrum sediminis TaxID=1905677 RepID=A0A2N5Y461_9GAMM|nr:TonB-dependent receptor [Kineobactrum sediminis]PLW83172.1 TonB-dependent receptor [Kineobactrum sediminis]
MKHNITLATGLLLALGSAHTVTAELEQVLVSAKRTSEDAARLPLAWSAVGEDTLALTGHTHPNEIMQRVPGAWISRGNGQESLTALRSPVLTGAGGCGSFFMALDGISLRAPGFCNVNQLFDANIEQAGRLEVIKGPAGATYGSNAMHGVINVLTAAPVAGAGHQLALEAGPDDYYRGKYRYSDSEGAHGISLRANASSDGGYQDDSGYDQQKLTLRHDYTGDIWSLQSVLDASNLEQETAGFIQGFKAYADDELKRSNPNPEAYRDAWSVRAYSEASRELGAGKRLTLTPYLRRNRMEFLQHFFPWQPVETNGHESLGLRAAIHSDGDSLSWVTGADLEYTDGWLREVQSEPFSPNQPAGVHYDYEVEATVGALYSQLRLDLGERWTLDGGLRLEHTRYDYNNRASDGPACAPSASACRFFRVADRTDSFTDWSLNIGASRLLAPGHYAYVRAANGFRAPDTSELYRLQSGQSVANLDSEVIDNLEAGLRGNTDWGLDYTLSAYYMNKDEVIFQDADRRNVSGAKTEHYGLEASIDYRSAGQWYARMDVTAARHRYDNDALPRGVSDSIEGNDMDTAPRMFGSARLGWEFAERFGDATVAELEWVYMDEYYLEPENRFEYEGHSLLNLRVSGALTQQLAATLRVTNVLDEDYAERADFGFGEYRYFVGQPRSVFVELRYQWGQG